VLCLGVYSPQLARQIGHDLPIYPVKGYSVTIPVTDMGRAPVFYDCAVQVASLR